MKKLALLLATLVLALTLCVPAMAEDLPVYTWGNTPEAYGTDTAPFSYKYIVKESGEIKDMSYVGNNQEFNPARDCYTPGATSAEYWNYAYCFISPSTMHPANNAMPATAFTATHSGTVTIKYVYFNPAATTELQIYKNAYGTDNLLKSQTPDLGDPPVTDYTIDVEVKKGDVILFALDAGETNANDETNFWINEVAYTTVTADPAPDTADTLSVVVALGTIALAGAVIVSKKH